MRPTLHCCTQKAVYEEYLVGVRTIEEHLRYVYMDGSLRITLNLIEYNGNQVADYMSKMRRLAGFTGSVMGRMANLVFMKRLPQYVWYLHQMLNIKTLLKGEMVENVWMLTTKNTHNRSAIVTADMRSVVRQTSKGACIRCRGPHMARERVKPKATATSRRSSSLLDQMKAY